MAQTAGIIYGKAFVLRVGAVQVTNLVSNSVSFKRATSDITSKNSSDWKELRPTLKEAQVGFEARFAFDAANGYTVLQAALDAGTQLQWRQTTGVSADLYHNGYGYITDLQVTAKYDDYMTFTGTLMNTGAVATTVEP